MWCVEDAWWSCATHLCSTSWMWRSFSIHTHTHTSPYTYCWGAPGSCTTSACTFLKLETTLVSCMTLSGNGVSVCGCEDCTSLCSLSGSMSTTCETQAHTANAHTHTHTQTLRHTHLQLGIWFHIHMVTHKKLNEPLLSQMENALNYSFSPCFLRFPSQDVD